jgi:hypothetical protein
MPRLERRLILEGLEPLSLKHIKQGDGKIAGTGTFYNKNGEKYEREFLNGKKMAKELLNLQMGDKYVGDWASDKRTGIGTVYYANGHMRENILQ